MKVKIRYKIYEHLGNQFLVPLDEGKPIFKDSYKSEFHAVEDIKSYVQNIPEIQRVEFILLPLVIVDYD